MYSELKFYQNRNVVWKIRSTLNRADISHWKVQELTGDMINPQMTTISLTEKVRL